MEPRDATSGVGRGPRTSAHGVAALLLLGLGLLACASSVIFIKASRLEPILLCALRLWVAVVALLPWYLRDLAAAQSVSTASLLARAWPAGLVLGAHFISWVIGARMTPAVNASLIVNLVPIVTPLWLYLLLRERIGGHEVLGTSVALAGVLLLQASSFRVGASTWQGDAVCFASMLLFALYLVLGRRERAAESLWLYVVPLYTCAAIVCTLASFAIESPLGTEWTPRELALAGALGLIPTVVGHSILNRSMQHMSGQLVGISNLSQPAFAAILAWLFLGEVPPLSSYLAGVVVLVGVLLTFRPSAPGASAVAPHSR